MTSLWQRLDETILAALRVAMNRGGLYAESWLLHSELGEVWQPDKWDFPALILYSRDVRMVAEEHGGSAGDTHVTARYSYVVVCLADGATYAEARSTAQELQRRVVLVLRQWPALFSTAIAAEPTDDEQPRRLRWTGATMRVEPHTSRTNSNKRPHWATASLGFEIESRQ